MMIKVKSIELKERDELEPLLVANPDVIEQGLQIVSHQLMTSLQLTPKVRWLLLNLKMNRTTDILIKG